MRSHWAGLVLAAAALFAIPSAQGETGIEDSRTASTAGATTFAYSWLGAVDTDENWELRDESPAEPLRGSVGTLPYAGGSGSRLWGERLRYGFEGGGLVSWKNDTFRFSSTDDGLRVQLENDLFSFEVFMGGMVNLEPAPGFRLYLSAGPALAWMRLNNDDDEVEVLPTAAGGSSIVIDLSNQEDDFSLALYGRAGMEYEFPNGFILGASARYVEHEFDFGSSGELELDSVQWFVTLGARM
jgi:hypothetical protein